MVCASELSNIFVSCFADTNVWLLGWNRTQFGRVYPGMSAVEYSFGTGSGAASVWTSVADIELGEHGVADAVALDFDGDGRVDDAMWDCNGDGIADMAALDTDDDGSMDEFYTDPSGFGVWDHRVGNDVRAGVGEAVAVDYDGDGFADDAMVDSDHDLQADAVLIGRNAAGADQGLRFAAMVVRGQPDISLVDSDGDGVLDGVFRRDEPGFIG